MIFLPILLGCPFNSRYFATDVEKKVY